MLRAEQKYYNQMRRAFLNVFWVLSAAAFLTQAELEVVARLQHNKVYCEASRTFFSLTPEFNNFEHLVETEDHYLIKVFRVNKAPADQLRKPVLLIHGIVDSSDDWALGDHSVVSNLVRRGYDVWLMNTRGNKYSCTHATLSNESKAFWDFSFHEMGMYDVPAVVKHIHKITGKKVTIGGHSQGTTQVFVAFAERDDLHNYVERFLAVAPVVYLTGFDPKNIWNYMATHHFLEAIELTGVTHILDHPINSGWSRNLLLKLFCTTRLSVCGYIMSKLTDRDPRKLDSRQYQFFLKHNPSRANIKSIKHFVQQIVHFEGGLRKYDYGDLENKRRYGSVTPPMYNVTKINVPVFMYYGDNDLLTTLQNVEWLRERLPKVRTHFYAGWGHLCYFWGIDRMKFVEDFIKDLEAEI